MSIKFFDMFSGIGGFRSGLEALDGFECIGYCEIDKYAKKAYEAIYDTEGELYFEDARTIDPKDLPDIDLIVGGFPCQSFSICGKRGGFEDARGTLFFEIAHTLTTSATQAYYFVDMNPDPKLTEIARCITARQNAGIGRRQAERSGVFIEEIDENAPFAVLIVDKNGEYHVGRIRRLTPRECWRLQGFTDEQFDRAAAAGISDNQLYKMAGNAVSVPVITAIGRVIKEVEERNTQNA